MHVFLTPSLLQGFPPQNELVTIVFAVRQQSHDDLSEVSEVRCQTHVSF